MYNDHINQPSAANTQKPLSIRLEPLPFNEKAAFVESLCATMIESRFGPGHSVPVNYRLTEQPDTEPAIFDEMTFECEVRPYAIVPDPGIVHSNTVDAVGSKPQPFGDACISIHFRNLSPPNQGRGSP